MRAALTFSASLHAGGAAGRESRYDRGLHGGGGGMTRGRRRERHTKLSGFDDDLDEYANNNRYHGIDEVVGKVSDV